jgi:NAD(P)-dependent dehydrogenase (short-subunit alcohol dehydrogenase family)
MNIRLEDKVVLVTGAASGIGEAYAEACAQAGAALVLLDRNEELLNATATRLSAAGASVDAHVVDITDAAALAAVFDQIPRLDGAFLNAGINAGASLRTADGQLGAFDSDTWRRVIDINLNAFFDSLQHTARIMKKQGSGNIVVTGSTAGVRAEPLVSYAYVAAKSAVHAVARQAALELVAFGIRINVIAPGPFNTRIGGSGPRPAEKTALWERSIPLGRWGNPEELAQLALLLVSDASSFMTGGVYVADGGASVLTQVRADELHLD